MAMAVASVYATSWLRLICFFVIVVRRRLAPRAGGAGVLHPLRHHRSAGPAGERGASPKGGVHPVAQGHRRHAHRVAPPVDVEDGDDQDRIGERLIAVPDDERRAGPGELLRRAGRHGRSVPGPGEPRRRSPLDLADRGRRGTPNGPYARCPPRRAGPTRTSRCRRRIRVSVCRGTRRGRDRPRVSSRSSRPTPTTATIDDDRVSDRSEPDPTLRSTPPVVNPFADPPRQPLEPRHGADEDERRGRD